MKQLIRGDFQNYQINELLVEKMESIIKRSDSDHQVKKIAADILEIMGKRSKLPS